jgi:hypothetical protein
LRTGQLYLPLFVPIPSVDLPCFQSKTFRCSPICNECAKTGFCGTPEIIDEKKDLLSVFDTRSAQAIVAHDSIQYRDARGKVYGLIDMMSRISEEQFRQIVEGIDEDRDIIIRHNPIGTPAETLLWMLMSCLVSYLSLTDNETPCFTGRPDADTYREAIRFILRNHSSPEFDPEPALARLSEV